MKVERVKKIFAIISKLHNENVEIYRLKNKTKSQLEQVEYNKTEILRLLNICRGVRE